MEKKIPPHREYESTFLLLSEEQRRAELSVYEIIFGTGPKTPTPPPAPQPLRGKRIRRTTSIATR